jgi:hypothetical protein
LEAIERRGQGVVSETWDAVAASGGRLRVVEVNPQTDSRWLAFAERHPDGSIYHHPAWLEVLNREYPGRQVALICEDAAGRLRGILALAQTKGLPFRARDPVLGRRLSSLPRTPVGGPLSLDRESSAALVTAAMARSGSEPGTQLQLKVASPSLDGTAGGLVRTPWRLTYVLTLPQNPEELGVGDGRTRRRNAWAVNKAMRSGVWVRVAETESDLRRWHRLYLETMRHLGVPARSYRFFRAAWDILGGRGLMRLLLAERRTGGDTRLLAGSCFLLFGQTVSYAFTGWLRADRSLRANDLIHWRAIQDACRDGYRYYDFGEVVEDQTSLAAFKRKWGGEPRRLYRYEYPAPDCGGEDPARPGGLVRPGKAVWRRLPLQATEWLSDRLYSYL